MTSRNRPAKRGGCLRSTDENSAYEDYKRVIESGKRQDQSGGAGFTYFGIGGEADFEVNYDT